MQTDLDAFRTIIARHYPALAGSPMRLLMEGWDSVAVEVDGRFIFRFPRDGEAGESLAREHAILQRVRPHLSMRVPALTLHQGPPAFSSHEMIPGDHLTTETYAVLGEASRDELGKMLARFYAELHGIPLTVFDDLPNVTFDAEPSPDEVEADLSAVLPDDLRAFSAETLAGWRAMGPDPYGEVFCFFDGHGWNMAFDHQRGVLNGVYDFADARIAPLQQDFIYSSFIARDLTLRIIASYEALTGKAMDRARVDLMFGILLIKEIAGWEAYPEKLPQILGLARTWVASL